MSKNKLTLFMKLIRHSYFTRRQESKGYLQSLVW